MTTEADPMSPAACRVTLVAAMARNTRVIGKDNAMPWHCPADLAHFKRVTMGRPVLMGRKTQESIGRVLPGRENWVLTRDALWQVDGITTFHSLTELERKMSDYEEVMVIGGGEIYAQFLSRAQRMWLTFVDWQGDGDAFFPAYHAEQWRIVTQESQPADHRNPYACEFVQLDRIMA